MPTTTSAELRSRCMSHHFLPIAQRYFAAEPRAQSILYCVAQYWNDEADDAVHEEFVVCPVRDPAPWPECLRDNPFVEPEGECTRTYQQFWRLREETRLGDNADMILAFASHIAEAGGQDDPLHQVYRPYAIARRREHGTGVDIEVVGRLLRPEWEDRADLVELVDGWTVQQATWENERRNASASSTAAPAPGPTADAAPPGTPRR